MRTADGSREQHPFPRRVGRYELLLPVGSGGMATVYLARAGGLGGFERDVALKLTHAHLRDHPDFAGELIEEAKIAARIRHPNVIPVLDVGEDPYGVFLVMEYIEGESLSGLLRRGDVPRPVGLRILFDALAGLHAAHELCTDDGAPMQLVHRDFSPQNILVGADGVARLADFGIAKISSRQGLTRSGTIKGKASYMAPEQARGKRVDRRTDVWAGGVVAWEIMAGGRLYSSGDDMATLLAIVSEVPPRLSDRGVDVPAEVEEIIATALARDPEKRPPTADAFRSGLEAAWTRTGRVAEPAEVAALVRATAGEALDERRTRARQIARLYREVGSLAGATSAAGGAQDTSNPDPFLVADVATETDPTRPEATSMSNVSRAADPTPPTTRVRTRVAIRRQWLAAAVGTLGIVAVGGSWAVRSSRVDAPGPPRSPLAIALPVETPAPLASTTASAPLPSPPLTVIASAALVRLQVDGRDVVVAPGSTSTTVETTPDGRARGMTLAGYTADGRTTHASVGGPASSVTLLFPPVRSPRPARRPAGPPPLAPDTLKP